jgi:NAD dependent epimerase/dehydratase family enzyme
MLAPYLGLRLLFGEFAQVLFASQKVEPSLAVASGFNYRYPQLDGALHAALSEQTRDS